MTPWLETLLNEMIGEDYCNVQSPPPKKKSAFILDEMCSRKHMAAELN